MGRPPQGRPANTRPVAPVAALDMSKQFPLPPDTMETLRRFTHEGKSCRNPGLLFDRYIGYLAGWRLDDKRSNPKREHLLLVAQSSIENELMLSVQRRWRAGIGQQAVFFEAAPKWRFLTGLGRKGPLEVGFTFHPLYGFPIIPGSSLKGLALAYAREQHVTEAELVRVFGAQTGMGAAIFYDAMPSKPPRLELDVMNPHYPKYYQGKAGKGKPPPPANWDSPQPIFFLTLGKDSGFEFAVGGAARAEAADWLKGGLAQLGAGAKTSAGYGYWKVTSN